MAGTFGERTRQLEQQIGSGTLVGTVVVDQSYAKYIHEDLSLKHPRGGKAHYLRDPLVDGHIGYLRRLANNTLRGDLRAEMREVTEDLSREVQVQAPIEMYGLKISGHPVVTDNGTTWYDRAPLMHRLTDDEIEARRRALDLRVD